MRALLVCCLALASCVSSKEKISQSLDTTSGSGATIQAQATAAEGEIRSVVTALKGLAVEGVTAWIATLESAAARQQAIIKEAGVIAAAVEKGREGVKGVRERFSWGRFLFKWGLIAALIVAGIAFLPQILPASLMGVFRVFRRSTKGFVTLLRQGKVDEAIALKRGSDPSFEAAWRAVKKEEKLG